MHLVWDSGFFPLFSDPPDPVLLSGISKKIHVILKSHSPILHKKNVFMLNQVSSEFKMLIFIGLLIKRIVQK